MSISSSSSSSASSSHRKKSKCWDNFIKLEISIDNKSKLIAYCKICNNFRITFEPFESLSDYETFIRLKKITAVYDVSSTSTTNLNNHIRKFHSNQLTLDSFFHFKSKTSRELLLNWIINNNHSFTVTEEAGFKEMIDSYSKSDEIIPGADQIRKDFDLMLIEKESKIKSLLFQDIDFFGVVTDIVRCPHTLNSFIGISISWISKFQFKKCKLLVDLVYLDDLHSGFNLSKIIAKSLEKLNILPKLVGFTADNARNNDTTCSELENYMETNKFNENKPAKYSGNESFIRCFAHVLNLVVGKGLDELSELISGLKEVVNSIRNSSTEREYFKSISGGTLPPKHIEIRWNSFYLVVVYYKNNIEAFKNYCVDRNILLPIKESVIKALIDYLEIFYETTLVISKHSWTLSQVLPMYNIIFNHLESLVVKSKERTEIKELTPSKKTSTTTSKTKFYFNPYSVLTNALEASLVKLREYYQKLDCSPFYILATSTDHRYRLKWFRQENTKWENGWIEAAEDTFQKAYELFKSYYEELDDELEEEDDEVSQSTSKKGLSRFEKVLFNTDDEDNEIDEYQEYIQMVLTPKERSMSMDEFWNIYHAKFPTISEMARCYNGCEGTSVYLEQRFTMVPELITPNRSSLSVNSIITAFKLRNFNSFIDDNKDIIEFLKKNQK